MVVKVTHHAIPASFRVDAETSKDADEDAGGDNDKEHYHQDPVEANIKRMNQLI